MTRFQIHESTTFRCYKDLVIFSDYEETFGGRQVHNVLADMPQQIINTHTDFSHYRHIQQVGRTYHLKRTQTMDILSDAANLLP